ncbi:MAG TPA: methyltransferase domain-containing protein [Anaerolineae bacterium]|nr:methyltransferase domain-containing protein [Anaerolineae bacterium]
MTSLAIPATEYVSCALCGHDDATLLHQGRDYVYGYPGEFPVVRCNHCGLTYLNPRPTQAAMPRYYPANYEPYRPAPTHWLPRLHQTLRYRNRCRVVTRLRAGGTLLDVGCSTGIFLAEMRRHSGWEVWGVEPNAEAAAYARDALHLTVTTGALADAHFPDAHFDVVTMFDVLEHVHAPRETLREIRRILRPGGYLICSVPNLDSLDAQLFGAYWIGYDVPRHLYTYSKRTLVAMLQAEELRPQKLFSFYGRYTAFALSLRILLKAQGRFNALWQRMLFFPLWRWWLLPYFYGVDQIGKGVIITAYARKDE